MLIWLGSGFPTYMLAYFLLGSYQTARLMAQTQARSLINAANMGGAYGALETVNATAIILAQPLAGYLYSINPVLIYPVSAGLAVLAIIITVLFSPVRFIRQYIRPGEEQT